MDLMLNMDAKKGSFIFQLYFMPIESNFDNISFF
jgi:hypothetical protein